jgi:hypothetical protein
MSELKLDSLELQTVTKDALTNWTDDKRKEFVKTFKDRARCAQFVLHCTANCIIQNAERRKFISRKHVNKLSADYINFNYYGAEFSRDRDDLTKIANERGKAILKGLPTLSKAVSVVQPEVSKKIIERDKLVTQCKKLTEKFVKVNETIVISELDEDMTIGEFRKMIKDREKEKNRLALEINEISKEARAFEEEIDKALYAGIPGLSDAVVKVVLDHREKAKALDQMTRRVEEQVMFGDSQAAMEILRGFEKDELKISDEIKSEFDTAMQALKLKAVAPAKKALKAK